VTTTTDTAPAFAGPSAADQAAAWAVPSRIVAAWASHDADAFANTFTDDGTMILPGLYRKGRDEIRMYMKAAFADTYKGTRVTGMPVNISFLGPDAMLMLTQGGVLQPGESKVSDLRAIRAFWLVVKRDGEWLLAAYMNSPHEVP
jgi:uncharacterized protein (TIGR02246 family)